MRVEPCELVERISLTPAIVPMARSSGVATLVAIVSGLAPGRLAETKMTGKSTCGSGDTASMAKATAPARMIERFSSVVATGRRMKGEDRLMGSGHVLLRGGVVGHEHRAPRAPVPRQAIEVQVDHRRREERQHLAHQQAADHHEAERLAQLGARARGPASAAARRTAPRASSSGSAGTAAAPPGRSRPRGDRPCARSASSAKSIIMIAFFFTMPMSRMMPMMAMRLRSLPVSSSASSAPTPGRRQRGENRDGVDVALVQDAQHDVHRHDGGEDQEQRAVERGAERLGRALEARLDARAACRSPAARARWRSPPRRATRPARG